MSSSVREPGRALEIIDRYLLRTLNLQAIQASEPGQKKIAVIIDFAEFVVPQGSAAAWRRIQRQCGQSAGLGQ
jgi:hypothetical protein